MEARVSGHPEHSDDPENRSEFSCSVKRKC